MTRRPAEHFSAGLGLAVSMIVAAPAAGALLLVETVPGFDFNVGQSPIELEIPFTTAQPIHGVGITALWTAVIADQVGGAFPWSLDMSIDVLAPDGVNMLFWPVVGGDRTIADYPLQDATEGFAGVSGNGEFIWTFFLNAPAPYTMGLRSVSYHLLTSVPDVQRTWSGTTEGGPLWNRPFFIAGISGQGPVSHHAMQFTVAAAGRYQFLSVVNDDVNFNFLYQGSFDASQPLSNLLDYGLGNGNAPNGTPPGTSLIDELLLENATYTYVTSQWSSTSPANPFVTTVTGPAQIVAVCTTCAPGDFNGDDAVDLDDYLFLADCLTGPDMSPAPTFAGASASQCLIAFDIEPDGDVDLQDAAAFQTDFSNISE